MRKIWKWLVRFVDSHFHAAKKTQNLKKETLNRLWWWWLYDCGSRSLIRNSLFDRNNATQWKQQFPDISRAGSNVIESDYVCRVWVCCVCDTRTISGITPVWCAFRGRRMEFVRLNSHTCSTRPCHHANVLLVRFGVIRFDDFFISISGFCAFWPEERGAIMIIIRWIILVSVIVAIGGCI